ncbi:hypothetical protein BD770DRAFT_90475 [Pilaira anomala]|nr:hypothetical protein BD770DRAFT_90475 [Pilaira anomala]
MDSAEGLKYPLSVLKNMFPGEEMPAGKVNVMYDIACLFANSFKQHFLDKGLKGRLAVPIFHAYAHVLSCQAKYNPRNLVEFGRTDGEATERLWADLNPFVKLTRSMLQSNRKLVLGQAIRYRNEAKKMNIAEALLKRFDNATAIVALKERELQGVSHAQRESEFQAWTEALRKVSLGKSCNKIWSDLPAEYGPVSRYYLIQAIVWRFGIYLAQFQTIAEPRLAFSDYDRSSSVTVAGETFFCSQLNKMVKELNRMREFISVSFPGFVLYDHDALNETTFNATCCLWEQFVERKKVLFKEAIRSNVWAYNNTFNKLHKQGHVGE